MLFLLARRAVNFTQEDWAKELGVRQSTVYRWERGKVIPRESERLLVRELLKRPMLRRRVFLHQESDQLLVLYGMVEPIEDCVSTYKQWRAFLREIGVLKSQDTGASA